MQENADGTRRGFFVGDGTGVGKGRQIAAVILDNVCQDRLRHIWCTISTSLLYDAHRDFTDLGRSDIKLYPLHKQPYGELPAEVQTADDPQSKATLMHAPSDHSDWCLATLVLDSPSNLVTCRLRMVSSFARISHSSCQIRTVSHGSISLSSGPPNLLAETPPLSKAVW